MRIALVCPYDIAAPGGVQGQVLGLAAELRALGHHVDTVAPGRPPTRTAVPAGAGAGAGGHVAVGRSFGLPVNGSISPMAPHPAAARRTRQVIEQGRYHVVHLHEPLAPSITIPALRLGSAPLVGTFHAAGDRTPYRLPGLAPVLRRLAQRLAVRAAVSPSAAELAQRHLGGAYHIVANGLDPTPFARPDPPARVPRSILFLGRDEPRKGLAVLLQALRSLPDDVVLWIAGPRPREAGPGADRRIRWLGPLDEAAKAERLQQASVLCAPSLGGESFGLVLLEAMAAGTPVVASDLPGYRAVTGQRPAAALLVPPGDSAALARALHAVLDERGLRCALGRAGPARAGHFTLDRMALRYVELYQQARAAQRPGSERAGIPGSRRGSG